MNKIISNGFVWLLLFLTLLTPLSFAQIVTPLFSENSSSTDKSGNAVCMILNDNLERGNTDETTNGAVTTLQNFLYDNGYYPHLGVGEFGWLTLYGVANFQRDHNLPSSGFFGPLTRAYIKTAHCSFTPPTTSNGNGGTEEGFSGTVSHINTSPANPLQPDFGTTTSSATPTTTPANSEISGIQTLELPYTNVHTSLDWKGIWGDASTSPEGVVHVRANASTTGAMAILSGSKNWSNYSYTADILANINGNFSLVGRYRDANNFLACTFDDYSVSIDETINGIRKKVANARLSLPPPMSIMISTNVRMDVRGNRISCSKTGAEDVSYTLPDNTDQTGGIGISIWHSVPGIAALDLRSIKVTPL